MSNETNPEQVVEENVTVVTEPAEDANTEVIKVTVPEGKEVVVITVPENVEVQVAHTTATEETKPEEPSFIDNVLTLSLVGILALAIIIVVIRKLISQKKTTQVVAVEEAAPVVEENAPTAPGSAGELKLHNVEPKTAAMLMAIVADKLQKPLNELRFISIKEVE